MFELKLLTVQIYCYEYTSSSRQTYAQAGPGKSN